MDPVAVSRMQQSKGSWVFFEKMPAPHPDYLTDAGPDQGGAAAAAGDIKAIVHQYVGRMINYQKILDEYYSSARP